MSRLPTGFPVRPPREERRRRIRESDACLHPWLWNGTVTKSAWRRHPAHGSRIVVEHAFLIPWNEDSKEADQFEQRVGRRIAEELDARGIWRPPTLVAVGRGSIECRQLQLPPAPDEELPEMVHFRPPGSSTSWTRSGCWTSCRSTRGPKARARCWPWPSGGDPADRRGLRARGLENAAAVVTAFAAAALLDGPYRRGNGRIAAAGRSPLR